MTAPPSRRRGRPPKARPAKEPRYPPLPFAAERARLKALMRRGGQTALLLSAPDEVLDDAGTDVALPTVDRLRFNLTGAQVERKRADDALREQLKVQAHATNSRRGLASDWLNWMAYCMHNDCAVLPSAFVDVAGFIDCLIAHGRKKATLEHHLWSIAEMNRRCHCPNPVADDLAKDFWRSRVRDKLSGDQKQARPFGYLAVEEVTALLRDPTRPRPGRRAKPEDRAIVEAAQRRRDLRDAALINMAYDLMMRSAELVSARWDRIDAAADGSGSYRMGKTKSDAAGTGMPRYLQTQTMADLVAWRAVAGPSPFIFHAVRERNADYEARPLPEPLPGELRDNPAAQERHTWPPLTTQEVGVIYRRSARLAGVSVERLSGHSTRVGGAQDMVEAGATNAEIQQAGGWKDPRMPAKYAAQPEAKRAGERRFRKLAALRDRDR